MNSLTRLLLAFAVLILSACGSNQPTPDVPTESSVESIHVGVNDTMPFLKTTSEANLIGKQIHGTSDLYEYTGVSSDVTFLVLNINHDVVLIQMPDGHTNRFGWGWFIYSESDRPDGESWVAGSPFHVGDTVCRSDDAVSYLPEETKITAVDGGYIQVEGHKGEYNDWLDYTHYEYCVK